MDSCPHPGFLRDLCICCGKRMDDGAGVAFGYIHKCCSWRACFIKLLPEKIYMNKNFNCRTCGLVVMRFLDYAMLM